MRLNFHCHSEDDDSEEIAAALAAIYALYRKESEESEASQEEHPSVSPWQLASRFESHAGAAKIAGRSQLNGAAAQPWRFSLSRKWSSLAVLLMLAASFNQFLQPVFALERIQFNDNSTQVEVPGEPKSQAASCNLRIALGLNQTVADIYVPDGARLLEESSGRLLAELPAHSRWQLALAPEQNLRRLVFSGSIVDLNSAPLIADKQLEFKQQAVYAASSRRMANSHNTGFEADAKVSFEKKPIFSLPLPGEVKRQDLLPVAFPSGLAAAQAAQSSAKGMPPPVVYSYLLMTGDDKSLLSYNGKSYRGSLIIKAYAGQSGFNVINLVELEDYLLSVLPSEMPASWNLEALKAQSIAARSYAIANRGKHASQGYDLKSTTEDQVYQGVQTESESSNRAVCETAGLVLKHGGKVVSAFFHSAAGGATEQAEHVWGSRVPYLKSVPDFDHESPHFNWNRSISVADIEENLRKQGKEIGGLLGIFPLERGLSQRVSLALIAGTLQTVLMSGEELRRVLALPSTVFNIGSDSQSYLLAGRGFGHGLGLSQWGAKYLSEQGYNAGQILSYYYRDVSLDRF